jgi:hypothetical protein
MPNVPNLITVRHALMAEPIKISLRYVGPEVDNGEMDIDEVSEALKGFSGAYGKIASRLFPDTTHQVRVAALRTGSFDVLVTAVGILAVSGESLNLIENVANAAKFVFRTITYVIGLKKHTKGQPCSAPL